MKIRLGSILLVFALLYTSAVALAQDAVSFTVEAGLDGYYKVGQWLPVRVLIENNGPNIDGRVEAVLPRADQGQITYAYPVSLPTQSRKEITLYVHPEAYASNLELALVDNAGQTLSKSIVSIKAVGDNDQLYGILTDQPSAYNVLSELDPPDGVANVAQLTASSLPDRAAALASLNTLIISNVDTGDLPAAQRAALSAWIANGGRLIVAGGSGWQKTSAGLRELLPLSPAATITLDNLSAVKDFVGSATTPSTAIVTTGALTPDARVILQQDGTPLVVQRSHGYGEVIYVGFDPANLRQTVFANSAPVEAQAWDGFLALQRKLTQPLPQKPAWSYGVQSWYTAANAAANIPNLNLPPASLICGFLLLYMVAIGPINYLVVRKLKRRELAWISVPLLTLAFVATAFLAGNVLRGQQPVLNRLALVEVWPSADQARVTGIVGLYAPQRAAYAVRADQGLLLRPVSDAAPYQATSDTSDWTLSSDAAALRARVDMDVAEVKTLSAEGEVPAPPFAAAVQIAVDRSGVRASGLVTNTSQLVLHDAVLLGPDVARNIGTFKPGDSVPVDFQLERAAQANRSTPSAPYYYSYNNGQGSGTLQDIAGPYRYDDPDAVHTRRYEMLNAILNGNNTVQSGRGTGLYLAGWSDQSPLEAAIADRPFGAYDTTLYIIDLNPAFQITSGTLTLPPGIFTWQPDNSTGPAMAPYDNQVYPGSYVLQFKLAQPIDYTTVKDLTFHLAASPSNLAGITLAVWNYRANNWTPLLDVQNGENVIAQPIDHVGPGGEIRLKADVVTSGPVQLDRADFTLTVQ